jgi:hypothetical protein
MVGLADIGSSTDAGNRYGDLNQDYVVRAAGHARRTHCTRHPTDHAALTAACCCPACSCWPGVAATARPEGL